MTYEKRLVETFFSEFDRFKPDFDASKDAVSHSKAIYKGAPVPHLYVPKLYGPNDLNTFKEALSGMHRVAKRTIELYLEHEEIRALFGFDERLDALIRVPHGYKNTVPMGRFDIFYYGPGDYQFCELNADGASAMNEDHELSQILMKTALMDTVKDQIEVTRFELFHSWVEEVKHLYGEFVEADSDRTAEPKPTVAILDFMDKGSPIEFEVFKTAFIEGGFNCHIVDPRALEVLDGHLYYDKIKLDIIYRRLVTKDLMDHYDEIPALVEGLLSGKTCVIGSIKTQIIHTKRFFEVLYEPELRKYLDEESIAFIEAHVPYTRPLKRHEGFDEYLQNREAFIIKPVDYYASKGVCAGKDYDDETWSRLLDEKLKEDYIIQRYCPVSLVDNVYEAADGQLTRESFNTITGLFTYNEKLAGVYVRAGLNAIISGLHDGYTMSTLAYQEK